MKRYLLLFAALVMMSISAIAVVYTGSCGSNVTYTLDTNSGLLKIRGSGGISKRFYSNTTNSYFGPQENLADYIKKVEIADGVTSIGDCAFEHCTGLTSITIPESVTSIGKNAFRDCTGLTSITIPNSVTNIGEYAFLGCSLSSLTIALTDEKDFVNYIQRADHSIYPEATKRIISIAGEELTSITIPNSVTSIGSRAFSQCSGLTSINVESGNGKYDSRENSNAIIEIATNTLIMGCKNTIIPNSVTGIGDYAFYCCTGLTSITIPNSVTSIGDCAFYDCTGLSNVTFNAKQCAKMGSEFEPVFQHCDNLTNLTIGNEVEIIPDYAFSRCHGLTSITIPNSVTSIGSDAFEYCTSLTSITIPNSVTSIRSGTFFNCFRLTSITIPNSVTSIGGSAFANCTGLTSITIPNSVNIIGGGAFEYCTGLTSITIPNSVTSIGVCAFQGCSNLISISIGKSVTSIGYHAFCNCSSLSSIICKAVTPPKLEEGTDVFLGVNQGSVILIVPSGSIFDYKYTRQWRKFGTIKPIDFIFSDSCGENLSYTLDLSIGLLEIEGTGAMDVYYSTSSPWFLKKDYIKTVEIKDGVTSIGDNALRGCTGLTSITIPESVTSIGEGAFRDCTGLTSITIPESVTSIGDNAFRGCSNLTFVTIPNSVSTIGKYVFRDCSSLTSVTVPNSVTSIGDYTFNNCSSLTSVTIPNSVSSIGSNAFCGCSNLTSVTIPNSVLTIGYNAFRGCSNLTSLTIPYSVFTIGNNAFRGCTSLSTITCEAEIPPSVGTGTFLQIPQTTGNLYVPYSSIDVYKTTDQWKDWGTILPIEENNDEDAIANIKAENDNHSAPIYNLQGQRINKLQKGINIIDGKKVLK